MSSRPLTRDGPLGRVEIRRFLVSGPSHVCVWEARGEERQRAFCERQRKPGPRVQSQGSVCRSVSLGLGYVVKDVLKHRKSDDGGFEYYVTWDGWRCEHIPSRRPHDPPAAPRRKWDETV